MRRPISRLRLFLLCAVLAQGIGILGAVQRAFLRPSDALSTNDGFKTPTSSQLSMLLSGVLDQTDDKKPTVFTATSTSLKTERVQDTANEPLLPLQSATSGLGNEAGLNCDLTGEARARYTSSDGRTWIVSDAVLEEIGNDLQRIVNCTEEGDVIAFNVTRVIQPRSRVVIPWQLTISSLIDGTDFDGDASENPAAKTTFTCPRKNSGLFLVQATSATFVDLVIEGCTFEEAEGVRSLVEVTGCETPGNSGLVALRRVTIRKNRLIAASGLRMSSSCSGLEMANVEIADNFCSSDGCGVFLAKRTSVENCTVARNIVDESNDQLSSLLYAQGSSNTTITIQGFVASENNLTIIRVRDGVLSLANGSFNRNTLAQNMRDSRFSSCIHLVKSLADISTCNFSSNSATSGSAIYAEDTTHVFLYGSLFRNNVAFWKGGCVYVDNSTVELKNSAATDNTAMSEGGVVYARRESNVKLENTAASDNRAMSYGGLVYAEESNVELKDTTVTGNIALRGGVVYAGGGSYVKLENTVASDNQAVVYAAWSTVELKNTTAINNRASQGGVLDMNRSNAKLESTAVTNNSAEHDGGAVYAWLSDVTLVNSAATNNRASRGGVVVVHYSTVNLESTTVTNNSAESDGGVVYAETHSNVNLENSAATDNNAGANGGVVYASNSHVKLESTAATNNIARFAGGVVHASNSGVRMKTSAATNNSAEHDGGVVYAFNSHMQLENSAVTDNNAGANGGVVYASNSHVTLNTTTATGNSAESNGGVVCAETNSHVNLENSAVTDNSATSNGGVVHASNSTVKLDNTNATFNSAESDGGVVYAETHSCVQLENSAVTDNTAESNGGVVYASNSHVQLENSAVTDNTAESNGGVVHAEKSKVTLERSRVSNNTAESNGGFMHSKDSTVTLVTTKANGNGAKNGGFVFAKHSTVTLDQTNAKSNTAEYGGFIYAEQSNATLKHTYATGNNAENEGGFVYAQQSAITLKNLTATNGSSESGALVYAGSSTVKIARSHWSSSTSKTAGGFVAASHGSSISIKDSTVVEGKSKDGGAIWLEKSNTTARNLTIAYCEADGDGGGVKGINASTFLCTDCLFHDNSANGGKGGAVFLDTDQDQTLALSLTLSRVENNKAELGGGVFFGCEERNGECLTKAVDCPFMALLITQLSGNKARIGGGAVFAGYLEAIRIRCSDASTDSSLSSNKDRDWKSLRSIKSVNDVCPSWKDNNARLYGPVIATYAVSAQMVIEDATNSGCESGEEGCAIESYRAGTELPAATVELVDRLDQKPATSDQPVSAIMSSKGGRFLTGSFVLEMKKGSCSFKHIEAFVPPGKYQLTVEFDKKEIKSIDIRVSVRECFVGESLSSAGICVDCSSTTYSFPPSKNDCQSCPENGNCTSQAITPNDGYWQKTPCSDRLYRCLPTAACEFEGRSDKLSKAVSDVTKCSFEESEIEDYMDAQCAEGYEGPLCGSCSDNYGSGLSSECKECLNWPFSVTYIAMSALFLLGLTAITIHGTLSALRGETRQIPSQSASSSLLLEEPDSPRTESDGESDDGVRTSEKFLAKWRAVEMFKITLSYTQVTVLLASLDVGWAFSLIVMADVAEFFGGLASDGIRRSVVCLRSKDLFIHPTALALVVNTCIVPCAVLHLWIVFWTPKSVRGKNDMPPRFLLKRCVLSLMVIWYITFVPVLKTALSVFLCVDVHDSTHLDGADVHNSTHKYWAVDTALECYQGDHSMLVYALVVAFVCPVYGILLGLFIATLGVPVQHLSYKHSWTFQTTGFLYRSYRMDRRRYWEVVIVARKVAIAFLVFCAHLFDSTLPITGVAHLITLAIAAHILASPYRQRFQNLNGFEIGSLFVSLLTTLVAIMLDDENYPDNITRELLTGACVLLNLITFCVFVFYFLKFAAEFFKSDLSEKGENCAPDTNMFCVLAQWIRYKIKHPKSRTGHEESESSTHSAVDD